ncbi:hypothetical protein [Streptomyces sp. NBC_00140]|uniref:hypothetical protein n=1 Tax=Streptomyces sp. NBC_00140 TaxID=2975664 RepID=UPI002251F800|nr:hypothetical protein [Streptomyces sp. NBC_00140]MCX5336583.1 hypothetical protein [Streptomyces sp. NBC_00140]
MASKDDLVANVVAEELRTQAARYGTLLPGCPAARLPGCPGLEDLVRGYLPPEHRDQRGVGCPSAALLD